MKICCAEECCSLSVKCQVSSACGFYHCCVRLSSHTVLVVCWKACGQLAQWCMLRASMCAAGTWLPLYPLCLTLYLHLIDCAANQPVSGQGLFTCVVSARLQLACVVVGVSLSCADSTRVYTLHGSCWSYLLGTTGWSTSPRRPCQLLCQLSAVCWCPAAVKLSLSFIPPQRVLCQGVAVGQSSQMMYTRVTHASR